jgi:hypothetical protein
MLDPRHGDAIWLPLAPNPQISIKQTGSNLDFWRHI